MSIKIFLENKDIGHFKPVKTKFSDHYDLVSEIYEEESWQEYWTKDLTVQDCTKISDINFANLDPQEIFDVITTLHKLDNNIGPENYYEDMIVIDDSKVIHEIDNFDSDNWDMIFENIIDITLKFLETEIGEEIHLLGKYARHVCVEPNLYVAENYTNIVEYYNNVKETIVELINKNGFHKTYELLQTE